MVAIRLLSLLLVLGWAATATATTEVAYEAVGAGADNQLLDIQSASCDAVEGCYNTTGSKCSDTPAARCLFAPVADGRCSRGNAASCIWPDGAGRCAGNTKIACLPDDAADRLLTLPEPSRCDQSTSAHCNRCHMEGKDTNQVRSRDQNLGNHF